MIRPLESRPADAITRHVEKLRQRRPRHLWFSIHQVSKA